MKKLIPAVILAFTVLAAAPAYAADHHPIQIDGVAVASDVQPEVKNNRTMVPLRVISESLGAKVGWSNSEVTMTKNEMKVTLKLNSNTAVRNGETVQLDAKPYLKNDRVVVPLRFIAETFGCKVNYSNSTVTVDTAPLTIDGVQVKALQEEYHMIMGGIVQQVRGNAYNEAIYDLFVHNEGAKVDAPASYEWRVNIDEPGSYYKNGQYDFLDDKGNSVKRFDLYTLNRAFPEETLKGYADVLVYDASEDQWYLFSDTARDSINQLMDTAAKNGFVKVISDTVV